VFQITGLNLDASHVAPKVMWFRGHEPELFASSKWFPAPTSFMVEHLTGERVVDRTNASSTMLYDVQSRQWSGRLLEATGLQAAHFGRIADSGEVVGTLTQQAAADLGLTAETRVIAGCGDDHGGSLGAGLVRAGMVCDVVGTAEPITATSSTPLLDSTRLVETHEHAAPGLWLVENPGFVSGGSVRWCSDLIGVTDPDDFEALALTAPAGAGGVVFLPGLGGATAPVWDDRARGAFSGLTLGHDRSHLARAVLEGCSFAFRDITDRLVELDIPTEEEVRVVGGGGRSKLWCQIKADVTGRPLRAVATRHATALGAGLLAAVAAAQYKSLSEAAGVLVQLAKVYEPRTELRPLYDEQYARYRQAFAALQPIGWPS
jgi:xylulokinase